MLKPLKKHHCRWAVITDDTFKSQLVSIENISAHLDILTTKAHRSYNIYVDNIELYIDGFEKKGHKVNIYYNKNNDIFTAKVRFNDKIKSSLRLINSKTFFPVKPADVFSALHYLYDELAEKSIIPTLTLPSFALSLWRYKYMKKNLPQTCIVAEDWIRASYAGGRTEVIAETMTDGKMYDMNSMYGAAMLQDMPVGKSYFTIERNKEKIGFYYCKVAQYNQFPVLWKKIEGALCFPADEFWGWFDGVEIDQAIKVGAKVDIDCGMEFEDKEPIFKEFANDIFKIKTDAKDAKVEWLEAFTKRMMVSLYGKFGFKRHVDRTVKVSIKELYADDFTGVPLDVDRRLYKQKSFSKAKYILPHLASHIAAIGRVMISEQIEEIVKQGRKVSYIATDGAFTDADLLTSDELGGWRLEGRAKNFQFKGIRTYTGTLDDEKIFKAAGINFQTRKDADAYFEGETIEIIKNNKITAVAVSNHVTMRNQSYKRKLNNNSSTPISIKEILANLNICDIMDKKENYQCQL